MKTSIVPSSTSPLPRPPWSPAQARQVIAALEQSGLSAASFARRHGIASQLIYTWRHRLAKAEPSLSFLPVKLNDEGNARGRTSGNSYLELNIAGLTLRIVGQVDTRQLQSVLGVLGDMPC